ncbi:MAG: DNA/RNA non-specific endonuclease [Rhodanobacter sp.]
MLDSEGGTVSASGTLRESFSGATRSSAEVQAQADASASGIAGDQGGHLVAHRFVLDQGSVNLFPQEGNFNMSAFKTLENDYARYTSQGYQVDFAHTLGDFDPLTGRPGSLSVRYEVTDANGNVIDTFADKFLNQPGQAYIRRAH